MEKALYKCLLLLLLLLLLLVHSCQCIFLDQHNEQSQASFSRCSSSTEAELEKRALGGKKQKAEKQSSCLVSQIAALLFINGNRQSLLTAHFFNQAGETKAKLFVKLGNTT